MKPRRPRKRETVLRELFDLVSQLEIEGQRKNVTLDGCLPLRETLDELRRSLPRSLK